MEKRIEYKGYVISSAPHPLSAGGFSSNGSVEHHTGSGVTDIILHGLQAIPFPTEKGADDYYIEYAKKFIDELKN